MLIRPYGNLGESSSPSEYNTYIGVVADNNDPLKLGRLKVDIEVYDNLTVNELPWAYPLLSTFLGNSPNSISFNVPEIGSQVRVSFPTKDIYAPYYSGCEMNEENKCTFFDEDYPNCYGHKDSKGNFMKINKRTGESTFQHSSTSNLQVIQDGTMAVTNPNGASIVFDIADNISLNDIRTFQVDADTVAIKTGMMTVDSKTTTFTGDVVVDGSFRSSMGVSAILPTPDGRLFVFTKGILTAVWGT